MLAKRRAQVTPFIILGLVVAIFFYIIISASQERARQLAATEESESAELLPPLDLYIEQCIERETLPVLVRLGRQGGLIEQKESDALEYHGENLSFFCDAEGLDPSFACFNSLITRQRMQNEIEDAAAKMIYSCINLNNFRKQGYEITEKGIMRLNITIAEDDVLAMLDYPLDVTYKNVTTEYNLFSRTLRVPLGRIYRLALKINNQEITSGSFDQTAWMAQHSAEIRIEKHKPYPHIIYILTLNNYSFQYALQGLPSVAQKIPEKRVFYGCCINNYDTACFANADPVKCVALGGDYSPNTACSCIEEDSGETLCGGKPCDSCPEAGKGNGESWCMYDGPVGKGYDYVGSRHYRQSCVNGSVFTEECRDYREELCAESVSSGKSSAACRVNRWYDCASCATETCCEDSRFRDCFWNYEFTTENKCVPEVPPGLRFWDYEGADVCLAANDKKECDGWSCPNVWVDSAARKCYSSGDCGNYRNVADRLTKEGFFETDVSDSPRDNIYLPDGWDRNPLAEGKGWKLALPLNTSARPLMLSQLRSSPAGNLPQIMAAAFNFLDSATGINPQDYLLPLKSKPKTNIIDFAFCSVWNAPGGDRDCGLCASDRLRPCTEYLCKSLGERCQFEMKAGFPVCAAPKGTDTTPPIIEFIDSELPKGFSAERTSMRGVNGIEISPMLPPHQPFTFTVKTDEESRCTLSLGPRLDQYHLPTVWFGDNAFATTHTVSLRVPPRISIPKKMLDFLNTSKTTDLIGIIADLPSQYERYKSLYSSQILKYKITQGKDLLQKLDPFMNNLSLKISLFSPFARGMIDDLITVYDSGSYAIFVNCKDRAGNENEEQFFVKFSVADASADSQPPMVVTSMPRDKTILPGNPGNVSMKVFIDEPAECRYSYSDMPFEQMENSLECPDSEYALSPEGEGTYACADTVNLPFDITKIFIRCADNAAKTERFTTRIEEGEKLGIKNDDPRFSSQEKAAREDSVLLTAPSGIGIPISLLPDTSLVFNSSAPELSLFLPELKECRIGKEDQNFEEKTAFSCAASPDLSLGTYYCTAKLDIPTADFDSSLGTRILDLARAQNTIAKQPSEITADYATKTVTLHFFDANINGENSADLSFDNPKIVLELKEKSECSYSGSKGSEGMFYCVEKRCEAPLSLPESERLEITCQNATMIGGEAKTHEYSIECAEMNALQRNIAQESAVIILTKKEERLAITKVTPEGVVQSADVILTANVNEDIVREGVQCGYGDDPYAFIALRKSGVKEFSVNLGVIDKDKDYTYYVRCVDQYGSEAQKTTQFRYAG
ncbi:MAG TPA: hypothetical protein VJI75_04545 [Candidatus Nanoarchaeia archaeon]|nr:hypothetical protein [Candidatus Nanoarchaeia archaeon]